MEHAGNDPVSGDGAESKVLLREIFCEAVEFTDEVFRAAFLDKACAGRRGLRERIDRLLAADAGGPTDAPLEVPTLRQIGPYRLVKKIGEGGWGTVYLAEQEQPIKRRVALKVIRLGMATQDVVARFESERQTLALMDHPNIARVFDAGATETGQPYFVMEWVPGVSVTNFADERRLSLRERIELFLQVCEAVQHAHQKGIIHRDLKPSNILVNSGSREHGLPKIIDFGIAKAMTSLGVDQTGFTAVEQFIGTPAYMSPEQAQGATSIDTRSDVYSLGVLLYELLAGRTPFETSALLQSGFGELRRTICETEPQRPSVRLNTVAEPDRSKIAEARGVGAPALAQEIRNDLDWVIMKCLEKDRDRRYESVSGLEEDLRNYLRNEPVRARPPSTAYRWGKWVRRNRVAFAASCAVLLALISGLAIALLGLAGERRARRKEAYQAYVADMQLSQRLLSVGNIRETRGRLKRYVPEKGEQDLRGWEWWELASECESDPHISLSGSGNRVTGVVFLDGNRLLTTGVDPVRIWDLDGNRLIQTGPADYGDMRAPLYAPRRNGFFYRRRWAEEMAPVFFDIEKNKGKSLEGLGKIDVLMAVSADDRMMALTRPAVNRVEVWDIDNQTNLYTFVPPGGEITALRFSPTEPLLAVGTEDGPMQLVDVEKKAAIATLRERSASGAKSLIEFSPDGRLLLAVDGRNSAVIWNVRERSMRTPFSVDLKVFGCAFSPNGKDLALGGQFGEISLWNTENWEREGILRGHLDQVQSLAFSPDGTKLASSGRDGEVKVWTELTGSGDRTGIKFDEAAEYLRISPDRKFFYRYLVGPQQLELWETEKLQRLSVRKVESRDAAAEAVLLRGGDSLIVGYRNGKLYRIGTRQEQREQWTFFSELIGLGASGDGTFLISCGKAIGSGLWELAVWHLPEMSLLKSIPHEPFWILSVTASGDKVALYNGHGWIEVRAVPSLAVLRRWRPYPGAEDGSGTFSPDGNKLATACSNGDRDIWDLTEDRADLHLPRTADQQESMQDSLAFSPDGRRLAMASGGELKLYDTQTGNEVWSDRVEGIRRVQLSFSENGERLLAIGSEGVRTWSTRPVKKGEIGWTRRN